MRPILALPLALAAAACSVENDPRNDTTTISYDPRPVENAARDLGNAIEESVSDIENVGERAGRVVNNVRDIDVDVDIRRNTAEENGT